MQQIRKSVGADDPEIAAQATVIVEMLPLLTLGSVRSESQRKVVVDNAKTAVGAAVSRVALQATRAKNATLKQWCEQVMVVFGLLSGGTESTMSMASPGAAKLPAVQPAQTRTQPAKTGSIKQEGHKWIVDGFNKPADPIILSSSQITQQSSVCICDCSDTIVQIQCSEQGAADAKGKLTAVSIDRCRSVGVVVEGDVIASVDLVNCRRAQLQVSGRLPIVNVDSSEGITVFLSAQSSDVSVVTSRAAEINLVHPVGWGRKNMAEAVSCAGKDVLDMEEGKTGSGEAAKKTMVKKTRRVVRKKAPMTSENAQGTLDEAAGEEANDEAGDNHVPGSLEGERDEDEEIEEEYEEEAESRDMPSREHGDAPRDFAQVNEEEGPVEMAEVPIPTQFRSHFDQHTGKLVTEPLQHAGN